MDMVQVKLPNNDAYSSIRGVYGGVGITICIALMYTMRKNLVESLGFLSILWGLYATCRIITIFSEGSLGSFGNLLDANGANLFQYCIIVIYH